RVAARMRDTCRRMAEFASWMRHPDGTLPLFNDAAQHAVCEPEAMLALVEQHCTPFSRDSQSAEGSALWSAQPGPHAPHSAPLRKASGSRLNGLRHFANTGVVVWHDEPWSVFWDVGDVGPGYQPGHAHADTLTFECSFQGCRLIVDSGTHSYDADAVRKYDRS